MKNLWRPPRGALPYEATPSMTTLGTWRVLILLVTVACVAMLFAPLVSDVLERLAEEPTGLP